MCTHQKYIYNKYIHKTILVKCGKCKACQQEKAARRATRIRNNCTFGLVPLFVTLTFKNEFLPYVPINSLQNNFVSVHRDNDVRWYRDSYKTKRVDKVLIEEVPISEKEVASTYFVPNITKRKDAISVCYYEDVKRFFKRLRVNYERMFKEKPLFSYYACSEFGSKTKRFHIHTLIFVPSSCESKFRKAILKSWAYADSWRTAKYIEVARNAASYCASYVNCGSNFPLFLKNSSFRQKHSYSKNFGCLLNAYSLCSVLDSTDKGSLSTSIEATDQLGSGFITNIPIPFYVINRYFPLFKGYSRLAPNQVQSVLLCPKNLRWQRDYFGQSLDISDEDIHKIEVRLSHAYQYYKAHTGKTYMDFIIDYERVHRCLKSTIFRLSFDSINSIEDYANFYTNWSDYENKKVHSLSLASIREAISPQINPNLLSDVVLRTLKLEDVFNKTCKQKDVVNFCMSQSGHDV